MLEHFNSYARFWTMLQCNNFNPPDKWPIYCHAVSALAFAQKPPRDIHFPQLQCLTTRLKINNTKSLYMYICTPTVITPLCVIVYT